MGDIYDELTPLYPLIYSDWEASITSQTVKLDQVPRAEWGPEASSILDVSCGIGTPSIRLAGLGSQVAASDLSPQAENALSVGDMRDLQKHHGAGFDVAISAGNSIPHLMDDREIIITIFPCTSLKKAGSRAQSMLTLYARRILPPARAT